jgi:hypothetical protein
LEAQAKLEPYRPSFPTRLTVRPSPRAQTALLEISATFKFDFS